jgi:hypothetical protein
LHGLRYLPQGATRANLSLRDRRKVVVGSRISKPL